MLANAVGRQSQPDRAALSPIHADWKHCRRHRTIGGHGQGRFYTPNGVEIPVAEIANFLSGGGYMGSSDLEPPYGRLTPSLHVKQGYDRPRWDYFDEDGCIVVQHSSRGFRDEEFPIQKPAREFRVLAFGDSFTWGSGVLAEDAWPHVLEVSMRARGPTQVVNCGFACGSYNPVGCVPAEEIQHQSLEIPDVVSNTFVEIDL